MLDSTTHWTSVWVALAAFGTLSVILMVCMCAACIMDPTTKKWTKVGCAVWIVATLTNAVLAFCILT